MYCAVEEQGIRTPWKRLDYGDGGQVVCTSIDNLVLHSQDSQLNDTTERYATLETPEYELVEKKQVLVRSREENPGSHRPRIIRIYSLGQNG